MNSLKQFTNHFYNANSENLVSDFYSYQDHPFRPLCNCHVQKFSSQNVCFTMFITTVCVA